MSELTSSQAEQLPPLALAVVVQRLRQRYEPITLFGETDWMRYQRLHLLEEREPKEYIEGMDNEFAKEVAGIDDEEEKKHKDEEDGEKDGLLANTIGGVAGVSRQLAKEDFILVLLKLMLNEWEQELNDRPDLEKRTAQGKVSTATYKQCRKHIKPLFKLLKDKVLTLSITCIAYALPAPSTRHLRPSA